MSKKLSMLFSTLYFAVILAIVVSISAPAVYACTANTYAINPKWPNFYLGYYHYVPGSPSIYFSTIDNGTYTWNNSPYKNPTFYYTSSSSSDGSINFVTSQICGRVGAFSCSSVNTTTHYWNTDFRYDIYCFTTGTTDSSCRNAGRVMNHEFGHVMTLDEGASSSDSLVSYVPFSNQTDGGIGSRRCGDNASLLLRYGSI